MRWLELKIPPPLVTLAFALAMWGVSRLTPELVFRVPLARSIAVALAVLGVLQAIAGIVAFRRARTTVNPMKPETTTSVVSTGIYRTTRNPMYLGMANVLAGWAVYLSNPVAALLLAGYVLYMNQFQIKPEERMLLAKFGPEFTQYMSRVRRWI